MFEMAAGGNNESCWAHQYYEGGIRNDNQQKSIPCQGIDGPDILIPETKGCYWVSCSEWDHSNISSFTTGVRGKSSFTHEFHIS